MGYLGFVRKERVKMEGVSVGAPCLFWDLEGPQWAPGRIYAGKVASISPDGVEVSVVSECVLVAGSDMSRQELVLAGAASAPRFLDDTVVHADTASMRDLVRALLIARRDRDDARMRAGAAVQMHAATMVAIVRDMSIPEAVRIEVEKLRNKNKG